MTETEGQGEIRAEACPACVLCGGEGEFIHQGQRDRLFSAGGSWNLKKCSNAECGLIWLDPMPLREDIGKAYTSYYTHASTESHDQKPGRLKSLYLRMTREYLAAKYGYKTGLKHSWVGSLLGKMMYLLPLRRQGLDGYARFLRAVPGGRLLDVGCGSGDWLAWMRELGWRAEGIDFDENAVNAARRRGLEVRCGALEQQAFPGESFDAVILSHVIEHVPDPAATLAECRRILKPGGKLVLFTPNSSSLGHRLFKEDWRGLEPPRHLHIFSLQSMRRVLGQAGFQSMVVRPHLAASVIYESLLLRRGSPGQSRRARVFARLFNILEWCLLKVSPSVGDCVAAIATK